MQLIDRVEDFKDEKAPIILTIGNFDGVHRGHLSVLQTTQKLAGTSGRIVVITFSNHPSEVLRPEEPPIPRLCTASHKIKLLEEQGVDTLISMQFTRWLAQHSAAEFIERVRQSIPFTHLVLGHDATLGRDRQGNRTTMTSLGEQWGFEVLYLEEFRFEGHPVSSTKIRHLIQEGHLERVEDLLGRPYSIYSVVKQGEGKGKHLGFPTANIEVTGLCLPPFGVYIVKVKLEDKVFQGIANLGIAPTVATQRQPILEVHLFDQIINLYDKNVEVVFQQFIRPEKKFESIDALKLQIRQDIEIARAYH